MSLSWRRFNGSLSLLPLLFLLCIPLFGHVSPCFSEEGGTGHYLPGSMASFIDGVPSEETFITRVNVASYQGSFEKTLPIAGIDAISADASVEAFGLTFCWRPPVEIHPEWSFAVSATIPFVIAEVEASIAGHVGSESVTIRRQDRKEGLGDIILMPVMLNQRISPDLNFNYRLTVYAPTGDYEVGRLANAGKNFWTYSPTVGVVYFGQENGVEASLYAGVDFNTKNKDTEYHSGDQFHVDATLAQHIPLLEGIAGVGITGFFYDQITGDSGSGARFGDFRSTASGVGPVVSYVMKTAQRDFVAELKWLHEFDVRRRLEGDTIFLKVMTSF